MISLILTLLVIGIVWGLIQRFIPFPPVVSTVITIVFVLIICVTLLQAFGIQIGNGLRL